jgi:hypothetical protein
MILNVLRASGAARCLPEPARRGAPPRPAALSNCLVLTKPDQPSGKVRRLAARGRARLGYSSRRDGCQEPRGGAGPPAAAARRAPSPGRGHRLSCARHAAKLRVSAASLREMAELPGGSGDAGGMPVQAGACPAVAHGGARAGVRGGLMHVTQWNPASSASGRNGQATRHTPWSAISVRRHSPDRTPVRAPPSSPMDDNPLGDADRTVRAWRPPGTPGGSPAEVARTAS